MPVWLLAASVVEPTPVRVMEVSTTEPGVSALHLKHLEPVVKAGKDLRKYSAFCLGNAALSGFSQQASIPFDDITAG
jgi:hypothetical protein